MGHEHVEPHQPFHDRGDRRGTLRPVVWFVDGGVETRTGDVIDQRAAHERRPLDMASRDRPPKEDRAHGAIDLAPERGVVPAQEVAAGAHDERQEGGLARRVPAPLERADAFIVGHRHSLPSVIVRRELRMPCQA